MGTISDKLMRVINTKEDIRKALISKGYDVPTSIPFKEYAKMISDLPCKIDDFPELPGDVTRWHFGGLTNEMMAAMDDPRLEDADGKGRFLSFKNFLWGGMSGVGGYKFNFKNSSEWNISVVQMKEHNDNRIVINNRLNAVQLSYKGTSIKIVIKLTGVEENNSRLKIYDDIDSSKEQSYNKDGIYEIDYITNDGANYVYFYITGGNYGELDLPITIEQLPLYPGALVFDGVDDYGTCDNFPILNKEKGYTVVALRQWINNSTNAAYLLSNAINNTTLGAFMFERNKDSRTYSFGRTTKISVNYNNPITYQTSNSYNSVEITAGTLLEGTDVLLVGANYKTITNLYANAAIWELVFLDHDATEEELTKIKDYFVKTYPWLFPDQAWTVTGKTNEDEDRATIANITGNGNNLVLSNFGFSENSGYGSYPFGMNVWNPDYIADQPYGTVHYPNDSKSYATTVKNNATNFRIKFRLRGLPEGGSFLIRVFDMNDLNTVLKTYTYTENGIHEFVYNDPNKPARIILYNGNTISNISEFYLDIIPEYEGYLVTDGVDDKIVSSVFGMGKDFTIVGDWKFIDNKKSGTGLVKASSFYIYNTMIGLDLYINSGSVTNSLDGIKSINAACSDGRAYDRNWNEILANTGNVVGSGGILEVSSSGGRFNRIAFKNLAIYPRILSKDDCIKAYKYLQTLKAK